MKKFIALISIILICITSTACNTGKKVLVSGVYNGFFLDRIEKEEISLQYQWGKRSGAPKTIDITFEGIEIKGEYNETGYMPYYHCDYDEYIYTDEAGTEYRVGINVKSGEPVTYMRLRKAKLSLDESERNTRDERLAIAKEYVEKYTEGEYVLIEEFERPWTTEDIRHTFIFSKKIGEYLTCDEVSISINSSGELCDISFQFAPSMKGIEKLNVNMDKANSSLSSRLDEVLNDGYTGRVEEQRVVRLKNGRYGILYDVEIQKNGIGCSGVQMFVYN